MTLPHFIPPMLAVFGAPFDSEEYLFEVKWDGYRALLFTEGGRYRLMSRNAVALNDHYPGLGFLSGLPEGIVLDGEIVAFVDGKPHFESLGPGSARNGAAVSYIAFDILYENFKPRMSLPLVERRALLEAAIAPHLQEHLVMNSAVEGRGTLFFDRVKEQGLEGVMAKRIQSPYLPGVRDGAWKKIKVASEIYCVIMGYVPREDGHGFKSLILASDTGAGLRHVGRVGTGFSHRQKDRLFEDMRARLAGAPCVPCPDKGVWLRPELYCKISYSEFTDAGLLRAPVFKSLLGSKGV
jgi:ATP-dependent DNA ligase